MGFEAGEIYNGVVKFYNQEKGFGFIEVPQSLSKDRVFIHYQNIIPETGKAKTLTEGQPVKFFVVQGPKGPEATLLRIGTHQEQANTDSADKRTHSGTVKFFKPEKGYGFIEVDGDEKTEDAYVHYHSIEGDGCRVLFEGQRVEFNVTEGRKGLEAINVRDIQHHKSVAAPAAAQPSGAIIYDGVVDYYNKQRGQGAIELVTDDGEKRMITLNENDIDLPGYAAFDVGDIVNFTIDTDEAGTEHAKNVRPGAKSAENTRFTDRIENEAKTARSR